MEVNVSCRGSCDPYSEWIQVRSPGTGTWPLDVDSCYGAQAAYELATWAEIAPSRL